MRTLLLWHQNIKNILSQAAFVRNKLADLVNQISYLFRIA